ncbi:phage holin family protein [Symbiobacterium thermophilum]|uniref:Holin n=1 Tax=Symbiobacterium thermophilum TaxID=2734 RepID=A0A953LJ34_SYMTR|nr:phage holin family protein [Symbiobacterium thermophilum]MBY6277896.1 holin [Symbiobacterium thermophilum]
MQAHDWFRPVAAVVGAVLSYLFGGWNALLGVLLAFVVADYATGVLAAAVEGRLSSAVGMRGIARKVMIFLIVALAHLADTVLGDSHMIRDATIFWYIANELLSIVENAGRIGVPIPPAISRAVEILRGKGEGQATER